VEDEYWCMQWSAELLPEAAMIPDLRVFLRVASACEQAVTAGTRVLMKQSAREVVLRDVQKKGPSLLKLPFLLSSFAENQKVLSTDRPGVAATVISGGSGA
jgi:hypothetical protein